MKASEPQDAAHLEVAGLHRWLADLARDTPPVDVPAILNLGAAVVLHGILEPCHLGRVLRLVDPAVAADLEADHARLHKDLVFLHEQAHAGGDLQEQRELAAGLLEALRRHLDRDERTLYRPLSRLLDLPDSGQPGAA